jgi:DNA repair protein RadD
VRDSLLSLGVTAAMVAGETPQDERERIIREFKAGTIRALTSVQVLGVGFNVPGVDLLAMLRPTLSSGLVVQQAGRASRPVYPPRFDPNGADAVERLAAIAVSAKPTALVLDFAGNMMRHGPVDAIGVDNFNWKPREKSDEPRARVCPKCDSINPISKETCVDCGHVFVKKVREANHDCRPVQAPLTTREWINVSRTEYRLHRKASDPTAPPSLRADTCGLRWYSEWISLERTGFARQCAEDWWLVMGGFPLVPGTVADALKRIGELDRVVAIKVKQDGKWWRVVERKIRRSDSTVEEIDENYQVHHEGARDTALEALRRMPLNELMGDAVQY